jgi:carboxyl-terminal processing protease
MLPASNSGLGMNFGFPDVCLTPPAAEPIPYPNLAMHEMAVPFAPNVLVSFVPGLNMGAETPITLGDETGDMSPFMGPGRFWMGNPTVLLNALPAISLLCPTNGNDFINPIGAVVVPAITNVFYSRAGAQPGDMSAEALQTLARALTAPGSFEAVLLPGGIAYVQVPIFSSGVPARMYDALRRFGAGTSALIVDLRGCPGGELTAAVELAGDFLPPGAVIVTAVDGEGDETVYRARGGGPGVPLFVLVDGRTASSAEIFAGALQAHGRAVVVGERTYGKGSAQELLPGLTGPGARYDTVATFLLPGGEPIEGRGIHPDLEVASAAALDAALDAVRAAATSLLSHDEVR